MSAPEVLLEGWLGEGFARWRQEIGSVPIPRLVDLPTAVAIVRAARDRLAAERALPPATGERHPEP